MFNSRIIIVAELTHCSVMLWQIYSLLSLPALIFCSPLTPACFFHSTFVCISCNLDAWITSVTLHPLYKVSFVYIFETMYCVQQSGFSIERSKNQLVQAHKRIDATCGCIYEFVEFCFIPPLIFHWKINCRMMTLEGCERSWGLFWAFFCYPWYTLVPWKVLYEPAGL